MRLTSESTGPASRRNVCAHVAAQHPGPTTDRRPPPRSTARGNTGVAEGRRVMRAGVGR